MVEHKIDPAPELVAALSRLIHKATREELLERLSDVEFDSDEFNKFFKSLEDESDRAVAIVSFSYIDNLLTQLMRRHMNTEISGGLDTLFDSTGPLGTASAKIKLAASIYWISPMVYHCLELLRKIRNEFAHRPFITGFDDHVVMGYLSTMSDQLRVWEDGIWDGMEGKLVERRSLSTRALFLIRSTLIANTMIGELLTAPVALRLGMPPHSALVGDEDLPPFLETLRLKTANVIIAYAGTPDS
jgi:DNA-binding MltR family transcriptional regulator